jgi:glycosyltransferase involved in cell wall biosynthesis
MRLGVLATHPIQYHAPLFRALAKAIDVTVYFAHQQTREGQARAGFGVEFEWDVPLLDGYKYQFLENRAGNPDVSTFSGCDTPEIFNIIRQERFDAFLVTGWYNKSFLQAMYACKRYGTPLLVRGDSQLTTPRSPIKRIAKEVFYRGFLRAFDRCLYVGERAREYYLHYGVPEDRLAFVPHFVDNDFFRSRAEVERGRREEIRHELGIESGQLALLFVGKFIEKKRPVDVVEGAAILRKLGHDAVVVFVGGGALERQIVQAGERLGVPTIIAGFKNQTELPAMYVAADMLVLPSDGGETWGLVVNEAMACGTPAAVSAAAGCQPDLIDEFSTGVSFGLSDTTELAKQVAQFSERSVEREVSSSLRAKCDKYSLTTAFAGIMEVAGNRR